MDQGPPSSRSFVEPDAELDALAHAVIGAAIEVHRELGPGLIEEVYERALCAELLRRNIPFARQVMAPVRYKGDVIGEARLDLLVAGKLIVELKSIDCFAPIHKAQVITYLRITGFKLALLINFNVPVLKDGIQRIIYSIHC
jgi:GxxExxY protein